jgi:hypothetical protein
MVRNIFRTIGGLLRYGMIGYGTIEYGTIGYGTVRYGAQEHSDKNTLPTVNYIPF